MRDVLPDLELHRIRSQYAFQTIDQTGFHVTEPYDFDLSTERLEVLQ
jgi:hypothetical protein